MDRVLEKLLDPSVVWVLIPILAIVAWGAIGVARSLRGSPDGGEDLRAELDQLRARVEELERARSGAAR